MTKVECRCGATELEISANPVVQFFCHCDDCQAVHGGAYAPESVYSADAVKVVRGDPTTWKLKRNPASPAANAARASSSMSWVGASGASMDTCFRPENSGLRFTCSANSLSGRSSTDLPHYKGMPARFGGSEEKVGW